MTSTCRGLAMVTVLAILGPIQAKATGYVLRYGEDRAECRAYRDGLNASKPRAPGAVERSVANSTGDVSLLKWERVPDGQSYPADKMIQYLWKRDANPGWYLTYPDGWKNWSGSKKDIATAKAHFLGSVGQASAGYRQQVTFRFGKIDIDNDGTEDAVALVSVNPGTRALFVLKAGGGKIDQQKTELTFRHDLWGSKSGQAFRKQDPAHRVNPGFSKAGLEPIEDALHGATYGVFTFRGTAFFDLWWLKDSKLAATRKPGPKDWELTVWKISDSRIEKRCVLEFEYQ